MTADERLALIRVKVERAKEHLHTLTGEVSSFLKSEPYVIDVKRDPHTRRLIYYVTSVRATPLRLAATAGDVIHNLRSALDHLAYQLVIVGTGTTPSSHIYFPIANDIQTYGKEAPRKVKGIRPDAKKAIDALKPYKGGNDILWRLHKLNNIDKHRILLTVGSTLRSLNLGAVLQRDLQQAISTMPAFAGQVVPQMDIFYGSDDRLFPLKQGDELFIDAPDAEANEQMQFAFEIAFGEPHILDGEPLLQTLQEMVDVVDTTILGFRPLLS